MDIKLAIDGKNCRMELVKVYHATVPRWHWEVCYDQDFHGVTIVACGFSARSYATREACERAARAWVNRIGVNA